MQSFYQKFEPDLELIATERINTFLCQELCKDSPEKIPTEIMHTKKIRAKRNSLWKFVLKKGNNSVKTVEKSLNFKTK